GVVHAGRAGGDGTAEGRRLLRGVALAGDGPVLVRRAGPGGGDSPREELRAVAGDPLSAVRCRSDGGRGPRFRPRAGGRVPSPGVAGAEGQIPQVDVGGTEFRRGVVPAHRRDQGRGVEPTAPAGGGAGARG